MTSIQDDYRPYQDRFGLVQDNNKGDVTGNGILYTAQAVIAFSDNYLLDEQQTLEFMYSIKCCEKSNGVLSRAPEGKDDQEGPDDYTGAALISKMLDDGALAARIVKRGRFGVYLFNEEYETDGEYKIGPFKVSRRKVSKIVFNLLSLGGNRRIKFVLNNTNPGYFTLSSWFGRQPSLVAQLKIAAKESPSLLESLMLHIDLLSSIFTKKDDHGAWALNWCQVRLIEGTGRMHDLSARFWRKQFDKHWSSVGELLGAYFNNPDHPSAKWLRRS